MLMHFENNTKVTLISGFLGSGKTTFIHHYIKNLPSSSFALVFNEFGDVAFDKNQFDEVYAKEVKNGSIFCVCKLEEFLQTLQTLIHEGVKHIIVETSGFSNPDKLGEVITYLRNSHQIDSPLFITLMDAYNVLKLLPIYPTVRHQIQAADVLILNKTDKVNDETKAQTWKKIKTINPRARYFEASYGVGDFTFFPIMPVKKPTVFGDTSDSRSLTLNDPHTPIEIAHYVQRIAFDVLRIKGYAHNISFDYVRNHEVNIRTNATHNRANLAIMYSTKDILETQLNEKLKDVIGMKRIISGFFDEISPSFSEQVKAMSHLHINHMVLRGFNGKNINDYSKEELLHEVFSTIIASGKKIHAIGSPLGKVRIDDEEAIKKNTRDLHKLIAFAKLLHIPYIRIFSFYIPEHVNPSDVEMQVIKHLSSWSNIAKEAGIILLLENEKMVYGDNAIRCHKILQFINSPYLRLAFDFANFVQVNEDPLQAFDLLSPYIVDFHIKDAHNGMNVLCGTGDGKIEQIIRRSIPMSHIRFYTLEPHLVTFEGLKALEIEEVMTLDYAKPFDAFQDQYLALLRLISTP